jgi:hypothetical protein
MTTAVAAAIRVVPALRRWSPRWRRLAAARVSFLRAIGLDRPAHPFADAHRRHSSRAATICGGMGER